MASSADTPPPLERPALHVQMPSYSGPSPDANVDANTDANDEDMTRDKPDPNLLAPDAPPMSPSDSREAASRLHDDLELLRAERVVSHQERDSTRPRSRLRSHNERVEDAFNSAPAAAAPVPAATPPKDTWLTKLWAKIRKFPRVLRYVVYAIPAGLLILIPVFLDLFAYDRKGDPVGGNGGVQLLWFGIWLEGTGFLL